MVNSLITKNISRKGNYWDNTVAKSFYIIIIYDKTYSNIKITEVDLFEYI